MTLQNPAYPVRLEVEYPERLSRLMTFVKWLLAIPHLFALTLLGVGAFVAAIIGWFAILITGRLPRGLFDAVVVMLGWTLRINVFQYWMTEQYPPFVWA